MWTLIGSWLSGPGLKVAKDNWRTIAAVGAIVLVFYFGKGWYDDQLQAVRAEAIAECNTVQLEEDLRVAQSELQEAKAREQDLRSELTSQQQEVDEQQEFIDDLQRDLETIPDDQISPRTRRFMEILSARSGVYHEND